MHSLPRSAMQQKTGVMGRGFRMGERVTILGLMGIIAFVAVWMAALHINELLGRMVYAVTVCTLCTRVLAARLTRLP